MQADKRITGRVVVTILLAGVVLVLFLVNRKAAPTGPPPPDESPKRMAMIDSASVEIDREVDSVLSHFGIENDWIQKRQIAIPNSTLHRIERRIIIPQDIVPVQINQALNLMARKHHARAIASENLKENTVTIHIDIDGIVTQTLILKPISQLQRSGRKVPYRGT